MKFLRNCDWEQRKLEEDISVVGGATPSKSNPDYWNGPIVWLSSQEIKEKYVSQGTYTITKKAVDDNTTKMVKEGTPLIVSRSGILARLFPISIPTTDVAINQDIKALIFDTDLINTNYFVAQLQKNEDFILKSIVKTGTTVQSINMPDFYKLQLSFPSKDEQDKVGQFFQRLDDTIALHQRKLTLLKQLKQTYLQALYPQNGENIPVLRFADFSEPWEQCKLGELAESFNYGLNASATEFDGENKYIRITDIDEESHRFIQSGLTSPDTDLLNADDYLLKEGDILFARTGASVGKSYRYEHLDGKVYYAGFLIRARIKPEFDSRYIFQSTLTEQYKSFIKITSQRSGQPGVNAQEYASFSISVPSRAEQAKIGTFFKELDDTIALYQQKVAHLKSLKSTLLKKMFI